MAPQILQPFAVDLALPTERGAVLGILQTGMVIGALLGRVLSGLIAAYAGWRAVFVCAAAVTGLSTLVLIPVIPLAPAQARLRYRDLFASLPGFVRAYPVLRGTIAMGFLMYAVMMGLWTVFAFHVRDLGYGSDVVGYIGLVSIFGALIAARVGRLADIYGTLTTGSIGWFVASLAFLVFLFAGGSLTGVTVGMGMFLIGAQTTQLSNLARIFAISDDARSRLNTLYMLLQYVGGAYGSLVCTWVFPANGWTGVCLVCLAHLALIGLLLAWLRVRSVRAAPAAA
jgi:predicted MFS family arabinose efflux permease